MLRKTFCFDDEVVDILTNLVCYKGHLPQGAPTSPVLSNMICLRMDRALMQYARKNRLKFTRYADDLTFSSTTKRAISSIASFENDSVALSSDIVGIITSNGFRVNDAKTGVFGRGTRQVVTGIVVNQKCNFRRDDYRFLRNLFYYWENNGMEAAARRYVSTDRGRRYLAKIFGEDANFSEAAFVNHVHGLLSYYLMIAKENGRHSKPLQKLWASFHDLAKTKVPEMPPERMVFRTDSAASFRRIGGEAHEDYGSLGTCFLVVDSLLVSARHCAKGQADADLNADYNDESMFNISENGVDVLVPYSEMRDGGVFDWLVVSAPEEFKSLPGLTIDFDYRVQEGESIFAYGYADGKRQLRKIEAKVVDIISDEVVVDRAFIKGMSGGPVLNTRGDAIGLVTKGSGEGSYDRDGQFMLLKCTAVLRN